MPEPDAATFTCPRCRAASHNPNDLREGYCSRCHDFTGARVTVVDDRPSLGYVIERLFAYVAVDTNGEGVIGQTLPGGMGFVPLVGADADRMLSYRPYAQQVATATGREVRLVRFDVRTDVERFGP